MGPNEFEIKIRSDATELLRVQQETAQRFRDLQGATAGASSKTEELTLKQSELKKIATELGREFPLLGSGMRMALNPAVGVVADHQSEHIYDNRFNCKLN